MKIGYFKYSDWCEWLATGLQNQVHQFDSDIGVAVNKRFYTSSTWFVRIEYFISQGRAVVACVAHNHEVGGSNPSPATIWEVIP